MIFVNLTALSPLIVLSAAIVFLMLVIAFHRSHKLTVVITIIALGLCLASAPAALSTKSPHVTALFDVDGYALLYMGLLFATGISVALLSYGYMEGRRSVKEEFYVLLLVATLGASVLVSSSHFASFFLGLEILSISLYVLIAYFRANPRDIEAGIKYLILASTSVSFLLFGMALVYADLGTMQFSRIAVWAAMPGSKSLFFLTGLAMVVVGIGFKLALVPFHLWTPDVYEGAPAPVSAFIATASKGAVFALLLRYFTVVGLRNFPALILFFAVVAVASMFVGNLSALLQNNVKRILAYSSIAHMGYLLVAFLASGELAAVAVTFYLIAYFITTVGAFGVMTVLSGKETDLDDMEDYRGLAFRHFWLAAIFTAMLLSLAGIPLTAGFIGKFYIFSAGVNAGLWWLVIILVVNSAIGLFYYLRIIMAIYAKPILPERQTAPATQRVALPASFSAIGGITLAALSLLLIWIGVYPSPLIRLIRAMVISIL